jgi:hypothetical protein
MVCAKSGDLKYSGVKIVRVQKVEGAGGGKLL